MRLPDPYVDSNAPGFSTARLGDVDPYIRDDMSDGSVLRTKVAAQYWTLDLSYPDLTEQEYNILISALAEAKRTSSTVDVLLPQYERYNVQGDASTAIVADGSSGSTVVISAVTALTGLPKPGDLFKLSNHPKVYKITKVVNNSSSWSLSLYPALATTTHNAKPVFNNILFSTTLEGDNLPIEDVTLEGFYKGINISLREVW